MQKLEKHEICLRARWILENGKILDDETSDRIEYLKNEVLEKVGNSDGGWTILYKDPNDGRYWELSHPESEMHGGGPEMLTNVSVQYVSDKYGFKNSI